MRWGRVFTDKKTEEQGGNLPKATQQVVAPEYRTGSRACAASLTPGVEAPLPNFSSYDSPMSPPSSSFLRESTPDFLIPPWVVVVVFPCETAL